MYISIFISLLVQILNSTVSFLNELRKVLDILWKHSLVVNVFFFKKFLIFNLQNNLPTLSNDTLPTALLLILLKNGLFTIIYTVYFFVTLNFFG